jgi:hypothetical protein
MKMEVTPAKDKKAAGVPLRPTTGKGTKYPLPFPPQAHLLADHIVLNLCFKKRLFLVIYFNTVQDQFFARSSKKYLCLSKKSVRQVFPIL